MAFANDRLSELAASGAADKRTVKALAREVLRLRAEVGELKQTIRNNEQGVRNCHEVAIIGTRGRPKRLSASEPSVIVAPRTEHSRKPQEAYDLVRRLYPGPYCELFATSERDGWTCFGNAIGKEITP